MSKPATKYISVADTAKIVREALKQAFPGVKFTVRSKSYSGGASINLGWTDGPTEYEVSQVAGKFQGASFDGMIDLKSYHDAEWNGERVHFGADYIFTSRGYSADFLRRRAESVAQYWGQPVPAIIEHPTGYVEIAENHVRIHDHFTLADLIMQKARRTRSV